MNLRCRCLHELEATAEGIMRKSILMATIALGATFACSGAQAQMFAFFAPPPEQQIAPQAVAPLPAEPSEDAQQTDPRLRRQLVDYRGKESAGTIVIDTPHTYLYLVLGSGKAMRYGIG